MKTIVYQKKIGTFSIFFKFPKNLMPKIELEKKNLGKANLQLSERSEPHIPRVYRKAPSMRAYLIFKDLLKIFYLERYFMILNLGMQHDKIIR